jgi:hypothetical protein
MNDQQISSIISMSAIRSSSPQLVASLLGLPVGDVITVVQQRAADITRLKIEMAEEARLDAMFDARAEREADYD